ncbi:MULTISPECIES: flagellar hook protein FlgE [unclassified Mesorhizobium]|jgi:flagellar hook protein FlgE|uniref:flagellar hook protein FlgE n=1 Tax=unclassified Mesorhizobium TaxID=325217 RepID=UPI000FCB30AE|nr:MULTISPECIES: flagellar hook protein FlgE [unclassified Mesorhizobium]RUU60241.1 flagellar hook protein FlgE [Mesorhizobium sp. M7A.T.Ca.TU.009.01.1.1]AZV20323.1 flagellar hook protein FlgE [Mesorhizobium sp. M7A.F.Ce.TU.012.03.2.1]RUT83785.1 flagellar hook protein FlgE [Mesorhizobium sp. M7A.T.Ca.US.000.02.1.1]RUT92219.1 flagellar hook protein FlgE [Mesorhizobium sp. M7A.T.Ca.US.000.02.2.1]RUT98310.1 flagellar hook protein FlgE [Mesorhizobium sp. M7A.T.Ca.TU.009.02.1.1]
MSLYGMMRTGVSGMNAQANRLSTVADNIANSDTTGYKRSSAEFSTLVMPSTGGAYNSGGVTTTIRQAVSDPGVLQYTTSVSDLAVSGDGFFVVQDPSGTPYLTRAGAFVPDGQGRLVNSAGFQLMAYSYDNGVPAATVNGFEGLVPVVISDQGMTATPSTEGSYAGNLPAGATPVATANLPAANAATAQYTSKSSMVAYDNLGNKKLLDVYFTNTGAGTWQVAVFDQSKATAGTSFPYTAGGLLGSANLTFDTTTGKLTGTPTGVSFTVPNGATLNLDLSALTQLGAGFTVSDAQVNGNAPSTIDKVQISKDGTIYAQYKDGSTKPLYKIPLADVQSPDQLTALPGNVYSQGTESGAVRVGFANEGKLGSIISGALENSNVDIAEELTNMIAAQRSYTANSKVFQTGSDLMDVLVNLKR